MRNNIVTLAGAGVCTTALLIGGAIASEINIDMTGWEAWDIESDTSNFIHTEDLGVGSQVTHCGYDNVTICTIGASWANELVIRFSSTDETAADQLYFQPAAGWTNSDGANTANCDTEPPEGPAGPFSTGGYIDIENDAGLPPILLADGILRVEIFETFDDVGDTVDATITGGSLDFLYQAEGEAAVCGPSLNPLCTMDQAGSGAYSDDPDGVPDTGDEIDIADGADGIVDTKDFSAMLIAFGAPPVDCETSPRPAGDGHPCDSAEDCFGDGDVDLDDFSKLLVQFGNDNGDCGDPGFCIYDDESCVPANLETCAADSLPNDSPQALFWAAEGDLTDVDLDGDIDCDDAFPPGACCDTSTGTCTDLNIVQCINADGTQWTEGGSCTGEDAVTCAFIPNDACDGAIAVSFPSATSYDSTGANTDGPAHADCDFDGQTYADLYYSFEVPSTLTGGVRITTCGVLGESSYDTDVVAYRYADQAAFDNRDCDDLEANLAGCNDDSPSCDDGVNGVTPFQSDLAIAAAPGEVILVRVGGWNDGDEGAGVITVEEILCDPAYERPNNCTTSPVINNGDHGFTAYFQDDSEQVDTDGDGTADAGLDAAVEFNSGDGVTFSQARLMWVDLSSAPGSNAGIPGTDARLSFYNINGVDLSTHDWCSGAPGSLIYEEEFITGFGNVAWFWLGDAWNVGETCEVVFELGAPVSIPAGTQVLMVPKFYDLPTSNFFDANGDGVVDSADGDTSHFLWTVNNEDFCAPSVGPYHLLGVWNPDTDGDEVGDGCVSYNLDENGGDLEPGASWDSFAYHLCD